MKCDIIKHHSSATQSNGKHIRKKTPKKTRQPFLQLLFLFSLRPQSIFYYISLLLSLRTWTKFAGRKGHLAHVSLLNHPAGK